MGNRGARPELGEVPRYLDPPPHDPRGPPAAAAATGSEELGRGAGLEPREVRSFEVRHVHAYRTKRVHMVCYGSLRRRDLVLGTGQVEGAIKDVLGKRCDHDGVRWIKERVQPVAQLRCIDINGDWTAFERFVHDRQHAAALLSSAPSRIQRRGPEELRNAG